MTNLIETLRQVNGHGLASIVAISDIGERLTKKSRATKEPRPAWAEGLYGLTRTVVNVGHDYEKAVLNQLKKSEGDLSFKAEESTVSKPIEDFPNNLLREGIKNPNQLYLRVFVGMGAKTSIETFYFNLSGENVTALVTDDFKDNYFPLKYGSVKQAVHGSEKEIMPRDYKLDNILYFQYGKLIYNGLDHSHYKLFNLGNV